jgi:hypothetical protein
MAAPPHQAIKKQSEHLFCLLVEYSMREIGGETPKQRLRRGNDRPGAERKAAGVALRKNEAPRREKVIRAAIDCIVEEVCTRSRPVPVLPGVQSPITPATGFCFFAVVEGTRKSINVTQHCHGNCGRQPCRASGYADRCYLELHQRAGVVRLNELIIHNRASSNERIIGAGRVVEQTDERCGIGFSVV